MKGGLLTESILNVFILLNANKIEYIFKNIHFFSSAR